ncbi:MAG: winged helix-turn-helix transcriptional regulator [Coriobacteriia bacterium]
MAPGGFIPSGACFVHSASERTIVHMKRLLIAADDIHTSAWLSSALGGLDATLSTCTLAQLFETLRAEEPTAIVVDAGRDAEEVVRKLETLVATGLELRVLLLVELEALTGLRLPMSISADFVVRGAASPEVAARMRTLVWPGEEPATQDMVRAENLVINLATYQATVDGEPVDFTYLEYALFAFLVTHPNRAYGREILLRRVWGDDYFGGPRTVDVHIRRVRAKIGPELSGRLETVRNVGYLWHA